MQEMATLNIKNLPDSLYASLRERARRQHRSLSQEVVHILVNAVEAEEPVSILGLKGLGREAWQGTDAADHVREERASWD